MAFSYLKYLYYYLRYPQRRDFLKMGYGIYFRHLRCSEEWRPHLENTKNFIKHAAEELPESNNLVVLGAGRLLDLDTDWAIQRFTRIILVDADPSLVSEWKKIIPKGKLETHILDLTNTLDYWSQELSNPQKLSSLKANEPSLSLPHDSIVISLNLLSQLPIYWRDRVLQRLNQEPGFLEYQYGELQEQHLKWLKNSAAHGIMIISDESFEYYKVGLEGSQVEPALYGKAAEMFGNLAGGWRLKLENYWDWDLAPQAKEQVDYGERHKVAARFFVKA